MNKGSVVPLFFQRRFKKPKSKLIATCTRQNVVLHVAFDVDPHASLLRDLITGPGNDVTNHELTEWSNSDPDSPFRHSKYDLARDGKILQFQRKQNLIRAGKNSHADAVRSTLLFLSWTAPHRWPSRMSSPNMVASGKFVCPLPESVRSLPHATWSAKFPGVALKTSVKQCTPEVYLRQGTYIVPGVTSPETLSRCLQELTTMLEPLVFS